MIRFGMRVLPLVVGLALMSGCTGRVEQGNSSSLSSAAVASSTTSGNPDVHYPVSYPIDSGFGTAASLASDSRDQKCAGLAMSPSLSSARPDGLGCPRQPASQTAGAQ
jgi:hypothetical protein